MMTTTNNSAHTTNNMTTSRPANRRFFTTSRPAATAAARTIAAAIAGLTLGLTACDQSASQPSVGTSAAPGTSGSATAPSGTGSTGDTMNIGEGIAGVTESAGTLPGRVAARARNLANDINAQQSQISGLASDIAGETMIDLNGVRFAIPEGWTEQEPANSMRLAQLESPGGALVTFSRFGGDVDANIARWVAQFSPADSVDRRATTINGQRVDTVFATGTYLDGGMMGTPTERPYWALYGAIISDPAARGDRTSMIFVKMTGAFEDIEADAPGYADLLNSMQTD